MYLIEYYPCIIFKRGMSFQYLVPEYFSGHYKYWCGRVYAYVAREDSYFVGEAFVEVAEFLVVERFYLSSVYYLFSFLKAVQYDVFGDYGLSCSRRRGDYNRVAGFYIINGFLLKRVIYHMDILY